MTPSEKDSPVAIKTKNRLFRYVMMGLINILVVEVIVGGSVLFYFIINPPGTPPILSDTCQPQAGPNNYYVDGQSTCGVCSDTLTKAQNSVTTPWCTVAKAAGVVAPGDTVNIQAGRYGQDFNFAISGTAAAPITYRGLGSVVIGSFTDVVDEDFHPTAGLSNVYDQPSSRAKGYNDVGYQTHFDPILVDEDNPTNPAKFTVLEQDGPITLAYVPSTAEVQRVEGSWLIENGKLYVHPYGNRLPSSANTDIVIGVTEGARHDVTANFNNFYDVGFGYNAMEEMRVTGQYNRFVNNFGLRGVSGSYNYVENAVAANLFYRLPAGDYSWIEQAEGWGFGVSGSYNTIKNVQVYHNFNNFIASGDNQTISNVVAHGAPNHGFETSHLTNSKLVNVVGFGNQDINYIRGGNQNTVYEGFTAQDGITFEELRNGKSSGLTFRNDIFGSCWIGEGGYGVASCEYEPTVTVENSIFLCNPGEQLRIQHCVNANMSTDPVYTLADYLAGCQAGTITNCMTLRNIRVVNTASEYTNVLAGGRYVPETDYWNVHISGPASPAYNAGSAQTTAPYDFESDARPQGDSYDIGADEYSLGAPSDTTPPVISGTVAAPSSSAATITWTTSEPATSQIQYGTTTGYGGLTALDPNFVTSHSVVIAGLSPDTTYHFGARSTDASGNEAISPDQTFRTLTAGDAVPPVISNVSTAPSSSAATITWTTNEPATSQIDYGLTAGYGSASTLDTNLVTSHSGQLVGLSQDTVYHFRVRSKDAAGNESATPDQTFRTLPAADATPPVVVSITAVPGRNSATITWTTNEPATSQVNYGTSSNYGKTTALNPTLMLQHSVPITGLRRNTTYHYRVRSKDAAGNETVSSDLTFRTLPK